MLLNHQLWCMLYSIWKMKLCAQKEGEEPFKNLEERKPCRFTQNIGPRPDVRIVESTQNSININEFKWVTQNGNLSLSNPTNILDKQVVVIAFHVWAT